jgi:hypothetical protein
MVVLWASACDPDVVTRRIESRIASNATANKRCFLCMTSLLFMYDIESRFIRNTGDGLNNIIPVDNFNKLQI